MTRSSFHLHPSRGSCDQQALFVCTLHLAGHELSGWKWPEQNPSIRSNVGCFEDSKNINYEWNRKKEQANILTGI